MDNPKKTAAMALQRLRKYEFGTFKVISDAVTCEAVSLAIKNLLNAKQAKKNPDIIIEISRKHGIQIKSSPLALSGLFRILDPRVAPSRKQCQSCKGSGCSKCNYTGATAGESAEEMICQQLEALAEGDGCEFAQKGIEGGLHGFSAKIKQPKKRRLDLNGAIASINKSGKIKLESLRVEQ